MLHLVKIKDHIRVTNPLSRNKATRIKMKGIKKESIIAVLHCYN